MNWTYAAAAVITVVGIFFGGLIIGSTRPATVVILTADDLGGFYKEVRK